MQVKAISACPDTDSATATQDPGAVFSWLFAAYHDRVRRFLWSLVRDWDLADELTQVTFVGMWQDMASGRVVTDPQDAFSLLATVARWAEVSHHRDRTRSREDLLRDVDVPLDQVPGAARAGTGGGIDDVVEARMRVGQLLAVLPADQRQVLALHLVADLTVAQVADQTGWTVRQVERKRAEGLRRLRVALGVPDAPAQTNARSREQILQVYVASVRRGRPVSVKALANRFGVSRPTVTQILRPVRAPEPPAQPGARQAVRAGLRELIRSGAWPAGAPLPAAEALAPSWGTSPRTVRYALHDLAAEGLLTRDPGRSGGFRVTAPPASPVGALPAPRREHCA
jgi:RNA polymerase sigma factor (sigma-70 family)